MASRSSSGIGVGITITLLGVACLALFITTIVFLSKFQGAQRQLNQNIAESEEFIRQDERNNDAIQRFKDPAKQARMSVVGYLNDSLKQTMGAVSGSANDTFTQLSEKLQKVEGASSNNLIGVVHTRDAEIADLKTKLDDSDKSRQTALQDLRNEADRTKALEEAHKKTIDSMNADIDRYKAEVEQYRQQVNEAKQGMDVREAKRTEASAQAESALKESIRKLDSENLQLKEQLGKLRAEKTSQILKPTPEATLVDGDIIALNSGANSVTINRGTRDKVILGMTFAVYSDATAIKPDAIGEYPRGKATIEVTNVGETSSVCRITSETKGNPVVRGDVIANAVYDPKKVYTFLIRGNFDPKGTGVATPNGAEDVKAMIVSWGGKTTDELTGAVDFLVLGQRPQLPPKPTKDTPEPVVREYIRLDTLAQQYDQLLQQAISTSLPVLNENRLNTLIGRTRGVR
jgi:hypothetical protein